MPVDLQKFTQKIFSVDDKIRWFAVLDKETIAKKFEKYAPGVKPLTPNPHERRTIIERLGTSLRESYKKQRYGEIKYILKSYENIDVLIFPAGRYVFTITSQPQALSGIILKITPILNDLKDKMEVELW